MFAAILFLSASGLRQGAGLFGGGTGRPGNLGADGAPVTNEEADLAGTVLKSAVKLVSGQASRAELSKELSEKLYGQRGEPGDMAELGIELVTQKGGSPVPLTGGKSADIPTTGKPGEKPIAGPDQKGAASNASGASPVSKLLPGPEIVSGKGKAALGEIWQRMKGFSVELSLMPVVFIGMVWVARVRRKKREPGFIPEFMAMLPDSDSEKYVMKHRVDSLPAEEFELLMALIYQRQGYRISLSAALASGRACRFKIARKAERILVQCHNFKNIHRVEIGLVRELHEAMADANVTGGLFIASCGYTWDARHFAKTKNIKLIGANPLDNLLTQARATPEENLLEITPWIPKFMTKVEMNTPHCPECEAEMDETTDGEMAAWLCNQRPECGGRRNVRKYRKGLRVAARDASISSVAAVAPQPASEGAVSNPGRELVQPKQMPPAKTAGAVTAPLGVAGRRSISAPETQAKPNAAAIAHNAVSKLQRDTLPEIFRAKPKTLQESARVVVTPDNPPRVPQGVAQIADTIPVPGPTRVAETKRNLGLLSSVVEEFKRRGFRSEETPLAKRKPVPSRPKSNAA